MDPEDVVGHQEHSTRGQISKDMAEMTLPCDISPDVSTRFLIIPGRPKISIEGHATMQSPTSTGHNAVLSSQFLSDMGKGALKKSLIEYDPGKERRWKPWKLWKHLIYTVGSPAVTDKHLTAACNVLCIFIRHTFSTAPRFFPEGQSVGQLWKEAFETLQRTFDLGKTKPALQVLDVLIESLSSFSDESAAEKLVQESTEPLLAILLAGNLPDRIKEALTVLSHFLRRGTLGLETLFSLAELMVEQNIQQWKRRLVENEVSSVAWESLPHNGITYVLLPLLLARGVQETRHAALKLIGIISGRMRNDRGSKGLLEIKGIITAYIASSSIDLDELAADVLPLLFDGPRQFEVYLESFQKPFGDDQLALFLASLQVGRSRAYLDENALFSLLHTEILAGSTPARRGFRSFRCLLSHGMSSIRNQTYKLLIWSSGSAAPISASVFEYVKIGLRYLHDEGDPHYRGEILSTTRMMVNRLNDSARFAYKESDPEGILPEYSRFLSHLLVFLLRELSANTSYQRHIMALNTLQLLCEAPDLQTCLSSLSAVGESLSSQLHQSQSLVLLLLDPFDDVRELSTRILRTVRCLGMSQVTELSSNRTLNGSLLEDPKLHLKVEQLAASSCRSDHADGLGRLYGLFMSTEMFEGLLARLENFLCSATTIRLPFHFPLHGIVLSLMHGMDQCFATEEQQVRILTLCDKIWELVQDHLCVDSPEFANEDQEDGDTVGPKDVLAYAWRALRDSSLLIHTLITKGTGNYSFYERAGNICLDQLIRLRHRGAFSTVAQTFAQCCKTVERSPETSIHDLRSHWHQVAVRQIDSQAGRLTRRSAGIPAMIACTLNPADGCSIKVFVEYFIDRARQPIVLSDGQRLENISLPQVHAFNCLREFVISSSFRSTSESYVLPLLELAATTLSSSAWAIRNCALMLFRACISRIDKQYTGSEISAQVPARSPFHLVLLLLEIVGGTDNLGYVLQLNENVHGPNNRHTVEAHVESAPERVFAALDLVARISLTADQWARLRPSIMTHLGSPIWAIRARAAEVVALTDQPHGETGAPIDLSTFTEDSVNENRMHGNILFCKQILRQTRTDLDLSGKPWSFLLALKPNINFLREMATSETISPMVRIAIFDLLNELCEIACEDLLMPSDAGVDRDSVRAFVVAYCQIDSSADLDHMDGSLRRLYALHRVYYLISSQAVHKTRSSEQLASLFVQLSKCDVSAIVSVLGKVGELCAFFEIQTYIKIICELAEDLDSKDCLPEILDLAANLLRPAPGAISPEQLEVLCRVVNNIQPSSHHAFNAKIQLQTCLLVACLVHGIEASTAASYTNLWLISLRIAARDVVDEPTRTTAARSILWLLSQIKTFAPSGEAITNKLDLIVVLIELVQDDDVDIRKIAAETVAVLTDTETPKLGYGSVMCSLAANEQLSYYIHQLHSETPELANVAARKVLGTSKTVSQHCQRHSVPSLLAEILKACSDLFAVEKQNLYIDEIRQVETWSKILTGVGIDKLSTRNIKAITQWCEQGLDCFSEALSNSASTQDMFPFGLTYNADILTLFMRVVSLAGIMQEAKLVEVNIAPLERGLTSLLEVVTTYGAHEMTRTALAGIVNRQ